MGPDFEPTVTSIKLPICVDLDGTLVTTDTLAESVLLLAHERTVDLLRLPRWLLGGKSQLKREVASRVRLDVPRLPFHREFLEYLRDERSKGRRIYLVTGAAASTALAVASHLGLFDAVFSTDGDVNLVGPAKLERMEREFGEGAFVYAGNSHVDMPIWRSTRQAILVGSPRGIARRLEGEGIHVLQRFDGNGQVFKAWRRALRPHQWAKNLLLVVPLLTSHNFLQPRLVGQVLTAFVAFCLCASATYLINDLLDIPADRQHPSKRHRPFAAGTLQAAWGVVLAGVLAVTSLSIGWTLGLDFVAMLALYFLLTLAYSFKLKQIVMVDILCLAGLYTLRILAGGIPAAAPVSPWLLAFSMFFFLSLACVKRASELVRLLAPGENLLGRAYQTEDRLPLTVLGISSGAMAVLVFAIYISSPAVVPLYSHPFRLWLICPLLLYWSSRVWIITGRGRMHDDPVVFAMKDRVSYLIALFIVVFALLAW
jgi:4-hydroxybenzoate polyprenyltransferase